MLSIFKKLFRKAPPAVVAPAENAFVSIPTPMPSIEVAHLSLAAITARFPEDLRPLLTADPEPSATVALPLPTILKQLPGGCVRMSLASLQRQAHGLIKPIAAGDKRMIEVPLGEVFRHVSPHSLRRRPDQRQTPIPESGYTLFGDSTNPYAVAAEDESQPQVLDLSRELAAVGFENKSRGLKMDDGLREHFNAATAAAEPAAASSAPVADWSPEAPALKTNGSAAPLAFAAPAPTALAISKPSGATLDLLFKPLAAGWPEEIRAELETVEEAARLVLPLADVESGLAKGRVVFSWAQIRAWLEPALEAPTAAAENTPLVLPLKLVAPAFLSASKASKTDRRSVAVDASIPSLFSDGREAQSAAVPPADAVPEPIADVRPSEPQPAHPPVASSANGQLPETVGEIFGQPHKRDWTPTEMVSGIVKLPGVAGAIVALQEGLQVASSLPDGVKSEVVAAFLPQIFARLNQYSSEMRLGEVDDLLFTTHGAHCQIYRLGYVFLAVLGKPGEALPWHELRLVSEELARQTHK